MYKLFTTLKYMVICANLQLYIRYQDRDFEWDESYQSLAMKETLALKLKQFNYVNVLMCVCVFVCKLNQPSRVTNNVPAGDSELKEQLRKVQKDRDDLSRELLSCKAQCDQLQEEYQQALMQNSELQQKHKKELEKLISGHKVALDKLALDKKMEREAEMASEVWCNFYSFGMI